MVLSSHQPAYLPWLGYMDKVIRSDVFVVLDSVQFERGSFINRNYVKTANGPVLLSIPLRIKNHLGSTMLKTEIDPDQAWEEKHLKTIKQAYSKAPRFRGLYPKLEALYSVRHRLLADLCHHHLAFWLEWMGIKKVLVRSGSLGLSEEKADLVLAICRHFQADRYISGPLGRDYLDEGAFEREGRSVEFQDYHHPTYPQINGEFTPRMGIVDLCMNTDDYSVISERRP